MILHKLRKVSSGFEKRTLLRQANDLEKLMFMFAYHPYKMYFQNFSDIDYNSIGEVRQDMFNILDDIENRIHVGNAAREIIEQHSYYHGDLIKLICNKDLDCGIAEKTLLEVFGPKFIPQFNVQLAKEVKTEKILFPCLAQVKLDGVRCLAFISKHGVVLKTRNGKVINYPFLSHVLGECATDTTLILDGELVLNMGLSKDRTSVSGKVNSALKGGTISISDDIVFHVFDQLYITEFDRGYCKRSYEDRYKIAKASVELCSSDFVKLVDNNILLSNVDADRVYEEAIQGGYEGLILKTWGHHYTFKRSADWIKLKEKLRVDLKCIAIQPGEGKYLGMIGSLFCVGEVDGKEVQVNVGSGLSDMDRMTGYGSYINKIIEIEYNSIVKNKVDGSYSLFLPRFICVREDKDNG